MTGELVLCLCITKWMIIVWPFLMQNAPFGNFKQCIIFTLVWLRKQPLWTRPWLGFVLLSVANRTQARQTCMFQVPAPVPALQSPEPNPETIHPDLSSSSVLTNSGWCWCAESINENYFQKLKHWSLPHINVTASPTHTKCVHTVTWQGGKSITWYRICCCTG